MGKRQGPGFARLVDRASRARVPLTAQLELTGRCNLSCQHCYLDLEHPEEELSTIEWKRIIDDLSAAGTMFLTFTGGELFLRRDVFELAHHARARGMALRLFTSGTRMRPGDLERIVALRPLAVEVSLYSAGAALHDAITRRRFSHRRTLRTVVGLRRRGVAVVIKTPVLKANLDEVRPLMRLAERVGAAARFDPAVLTKRDGALDPVMLRPSPEELARVLAMAELRDPGVPLLQEQRAPDAPTCGIARTHARIGPNGDVFPCGVYPEAAGNLRRERLVDLWSDSPLLKRLRELTMGTLGPTCSGCEKNGYCGRCLAMAMMEDGDVLGPSQEACGRAEAFERAAGIPAERLVRRVETPSGKRRLPLAPVYVNRC